MEQYQKFNRPVIGVPERKELRMGKNIFIRTNAPRFPQFSKAYKFKDLKSLIKPREVKFKAKNNI